MAEREKRTQELLKSTDASTVRRKKAARSSWAIGFNKALTQNVSHERVRAYAEAFQKIQDATGGWWTEAAGWLGGHSAMMTASQDEADSSDHRHTAASGGYDTTHALPSSGFIPNQQAFLTLTRWWLRLLPVKMPTSPCSTMSPRCAAVSVGVGES